MTVPATIPVTHILLYNVRKRMQLAFPCNMVPSEAQRKENTPHCTGLWTLPYKRVYGTPYYASISYSLGNFRTDD